ncbi:MAG: HlyD family efflux transporter periplasmic adaptor subunit [Alphaproteobacteria bacterium]|nr:HlyD family efflux transporter periplasmic adaptor subunit [Alphaproteobacteria bacterium]MCB9985936.1 HlyD family efflux transporter periplasmic adaptor subunit [Micavibrio sp.]
MDKLLTLLTLARQAQEAETRSEFLHVVVNQSNKLISYRQALVWSQRFFGPELEKISGNAVLDPKGPYALSILDQLKTLDKDKIGIQKKQNETDQSYLTFVPFKTKQDGLLGGLILEHETAYTDDENKIIEELVQSYSPIFALHDLRRMATFPHRIKNIFHRQSKFRKIAIIVALALLFFPVRTSITAPIEIVPKDADYMTSPMDGLVSAVLVEPGEEVEQGQVIVNMDDTVLRADMDLAEQTLEVAISSLSRLRRESLSIPEKKAELSQLESDIAEKKIKLDYTKTLLARSEIKAQRSGIAIFSAKESLEGHPVHAGDVLIKIADPVHIEALIRVPVEAMIPVTNQADVNFFLSVQPSKSYRATIRNIGYESSLDADGLSTYKIIADLHGQENLKIGWKGQAKIRTSWSILFLDLLRRPVLFVRQLSGI